ncbi:MAG: hypothetical protein A2Z20_06015 [Bdellovibrionales bacterium RBG_16_40_8]|nr:MAG: hypothetical protein A2Z20_06015 [Bdellovibrionales bacterium RBG_16_40_8]
MSLRLKITSGPLQGREYQLKPGIIIGRSGAEISINDAKISGRHAKIENGPAGDLLMIDLGSTNGLLVQGKKLTQVSLTHGLTIRIGNTFCEIQKMAPSSKIEDSTLPPLPNKPPKPREPSDYFADLNLVLSKKLKNKIRAILPFKPLVILQVTHGLQTGTEWTLGYGPRTFGASELDLHILDPGAPPHTFSVEPRNNRIYLTTAHPQKIRLNGRAISSEELKNGDEIAVADTRIKVSFSDESD